MPGLAENQRARACRAVCAAAGLSGLWGWNSPTARADAILRTKGGSLSRSQFTAVRVAWGLWNGRGELAVADMLESLAPPVLRVVGALLAASGNGHDAVERFLAEQGQVVPSADAGEAAP